MPAIVVFLLLSNPLFAAYNPFFNEAPKAEKKVEKPRPKPQPKIIYKKPEKKKVFDIVYFGFLETNRGKFALLETGDKSFAVRKGDSLYLQNSKIDIVKITSNYFVLRSDRKNYQTIHFSKRSAR